VIANQESNPFPPLAEDAAASGQKLLTVSEAAELLGVDSFTVLSLIQRGKVIPSRAPSGEITLAKRELAKLTGKGR
jgi:excisionase family DNA binding protein